VMSPKTVSLLLVATLAILAVTVMSDPAFASSGGGLPWETPLNKVKDSLSGPVALAVGVIAFFAGGAMLVFGGEMTDFARRAALVVLACGFLLGGSNLLTTLYGTTSTSIGAPAAPVSELVGDVHG
jgi:type IV secretory pathway VirB2 component (pilin)